MIRLDPATASSSAPPSVPAWAITTAGAPSDGDAAFRAGAALGALDTLARSAFLGRGLAAAAGAPLCRRQHAARRPRRGRGGLARCLAFASSGSDPGPAGAVFGAWRQLAGQPPAAMPDRLEKILDQLGLHWDGDALADLCTQIEKLVVSHRSAPFDAAAIAAEVVAMRPDSELFAWWLADLVLAQRLGWQRPLPLLMAQVFGPSFRTEASGGRRIRPGDKNFERAVCVALVAAAADACRLAAELSRRAEKLLAVAPKLRAKGAGDVIFLLLSEDAVSGSLATKNLSRFASRRLFERLQQLEAVRELSGRPTFRLFGL